MGLRIDTKIGALATERTAPQQATGHSPVGVGAGQPTGSTAAATEDTATLSVPGHFGAQVRQGVQATTGLQVGITALQAADTGLKTQQGALNKLRAVAQQATNETLSPNQRGKLANQANQITNGIQKTAENTRAFGVQLLKPPTPHVGENNPPPNPAPVTVQPSTPETLGVSGLNLTTPRDASAALNAVRTAQSHVEQNRTNVTTQLAELTQKANARQTAHAANQQAHTQLRNANETRQAVQEAHNLTVSLGRGALAVQGNLNPAQAARVLGH